MGAVFGKEKPLKDIIRENQRMIKKVGSTILRSLAIFGKDNDHERF